MHVFMHILRGSIAVSMKCCLCVFGVIMMLVSQDSASAEAIENMRSTFDRYKIEVVTQTPNGTESLSGNLWYVDAGEGAENLVARAVKDFFNRNGLQLSDYCLAWQERTFEGLIENEDGLLIKQYRAKAIYRRKDTVAPLPLEETVREHKEEFHELLPKKEFNVAGISLTFCLWAAYLDWVMSGRATRLLGRFGINWRYPTNRRPPAKRRRDIPERKRKEKNDDE